MQKNKFSILLIVSLVSLVIALLMLYLVFVNNKQLQDTIVLYGFVWSIFSFSFSIFFYGILHTIAEVRGKKFDVDFSIKGAGAFLVILLFVGFFFIYKSYEQSKNNYKDVPDTLGVIINHNLIVNKLNDSTSKTSTSSIVKPNSPVLGPKKLNNDLITSTISGRILFPDNSFSAGIKVVSGDYQTETNQNGFFKLNVQHHQNVLVLSIRCFKEGKELKLESDKIGVEEPEKDFKVKPN
jgi:hypothetical protein